MLALRAIETCFFPDFFPILKILAVCVIGVTVQPPIVFALRREAVGRRRP